MPNERLVSTRRLISTIVLLSSRGYSIAEIAKRHDVSIKTVYRDLKAIEDLNIPLYKSEVTLDSMAERGLWSVDKHWMKRFL